MTKGNPLWNTSYNSTVTIQEKKKKSLLDLGHLIWQKTWLNFMGDHFTPLVQKLFCSSSDHQDRATAFPPKRLWLKKHFLHYPSPTKGLCHPWEGGGCIQSLQALLGQHRIRAPRSLTLLWHSYHQTQTLRVICLCKSVHRQEADSSESWEKL